MSTSSKLDPERFPGGNLTQITYMGKIALGRTLRSFASGLLHHYYRENNTVTKIMDSGVKLFKI